jgi:plastocyanin
VSITIEGFAFESGITVAPGQTVTVVNADGAPHTLTATNDEFDTGRLSGGASGTFVAPSEPGTYDFFCAVHPSMTGTLTVAG